MKITIEITPRPQLIAFLGTREAAENLIYQDICEVLLPNLQKPMLIQDFTMKREVD